MSLDEEFKKEFSNWCTKNNRGLVSRGNVMGSKKGISCKCRKTGREIKITDNKIRVKNEEYYYEEIHFDDGSIIIMRENKNDLRVEPEKFFG